jgi:hypothetical protein
LWVEFCYSQTWAALVITNHLIIKNICIDEVKALSITKNFVLTFYRFMPRLIFMKNFFRLFYLLLLVLCYHTTYAKHVKGGHIEYKYNGAGATAGTSNYTFTVTVFFSCTTTGPKATM